MSDELLEEIVESLRKQTRVIEDLFDIVKILVERLHELEAKGCGRIENR